jgi:hypothetical protein
MHEKMPAEPLSARPGDVEQIVKALGRRIRHRRRLTAGLAIVVALVVAIPLIVLLTGGNGTKTQPGSTSVVDEIRIGGAEYLAAEGHVPRSTLGRQVATVRAQRTVSDTGIAGKGSGGSSQPSSGTVDSTTLPIGTPIYAVHPYRTSFRVAAVISGRVKLYDAYTNPQARLGGDLLDLSGKVRQLDVYDTSTDRLRGRLSDKRTIDKLIHELEASPVAGSRGSGDPQMRVTFRLNDGTDVNCTLLTSGLLLPGNIRVPTGFGVALSHLAR